MSIILLDADDVLLDWIGGFRQYAAERLGHKVVGEPQSWHMGEWLGSTDEVALELVGEFNSSHAFGELGAVEGSKPIIEQMRMDDEMRLHVITSCSSDDETVRLRRSNLEDLFGIGTFDSIHCLDLGQSKASILKAFEPGALWVEDNYKNAVLGADAGHIVLLRERPHNREYRDINDPRINWFTTWEELGEMS